MLAVAWAVNHYQQYVYGKRCKILNDHTPLQQIIKKDIRDTSTWLQRLLLRCQGYDFTIESGFETNGCPIARGHVKFGLGN